MDPWEINFTEKCNENTDEATVSADSNTSGQGFDGILKRDSSILSSQLDVTDVKLLDEEEFDFDLPCSPALSETRSDEVDEVNEAANGHAVVQNDDDDEIFIGPVGYTEKCVSVAVEATVRTASLLQRRETLTAAEMAELCKEAFTVASRIQLSAVTESPASGCGEADICTSDDLSADSLSSPIVSACSTSTDFKCSKSVVSSSPAAVTMKLINDAQLKTIRTGASVEKPFTGGRALATPNKFYRVQPVGSAKKENSSIPNPLLKKRKFENEVEKTNSTFEELSSNVIPAVLGTSEPLTKRLCVDSETKNCTGDKPSVQSNGKTSVQPVKPSLLPSHLPQAKKSRLLPPGSLLAAQKVVTSVAPKITESSENTAIAKHSPTTMGIPTSNIRRAQSLLPISNALNTRPGECRLSRLQPPKTIAKLHRREDNADSQSRLFNQSKAHGKENMSN